MNIEEEKSLFHEKVTLLVGQSISRVRYSTIEYPDGKSYWEHGDFHNAELGVELTTSTGIIFQIGWDWVFNHYHLAILQPKDESESLWRESTVIWDVTADPKWASIIAEEIIRTTEFWCKTGNKSYPSPDYPQDLEITFKSGRQVWLSVAGYDESTGQLFGMHDEVIIVFDEDVMKRHQFGEYTPKEWLHRTAAHNNGMQRTRN